MPQPIPFTTGNDDLKSKNNEKSIEIGVLIEEILQAFELFDGVYKYEAVEAAIAIREEITPHLIESLETVLASPEEYCDDNRYFLHIYAAILLGHFREERAHDVLVKLCSLPDELSPKLFGDVLNNDMPLILMRTCGGDDTKIRELVKNTGADLYCRHMALRALISGVIKRVLDRDAVLSFIGTLFTGKEAEEGSDFWSIAALHANDLYPEEIMEAIDGGYEAGLVSEFFIDREEFTNVLSRDREEWLEMLYEDPEPDAFEDVHKVMEWWDCFKLAEEGLQLRKPISDKKRKAKRKKHKMARKSKRKNRKK